MARYFTQAQRKDAEAAGSSSKPGPGYVGAIDDKYLKHKITKCSPVDCSQKLERH